MTIELAQLSLQIDEMAQELKARQQEHGQHLECALETWCREARNFEALKRKIELSRRTVTLPAGLVERLDETHSLPRSPSDFRVLAVDGSHIDVDRHQATRCYLLNLGAALLRYGTQPDAHFFSKPFLYSRDEDLVIRDPQNPGRSTLLEGPLLAIKRSVLECSFLAELTRGLPDNIPTLALMDGSLILWGLVWRALDDYVKKTLLHQGLLTGLSQLRSQPRLTLASYISFPRSAEVISSLRIAICPYEPVDCDRCRESPNDRACNTLNGLLDRDLFQSLLQPAERSPIFASLSPVVLEHYGEHSVRFFYLNVGEEIARVELPQWVMEETASLDLLHSLIYEQCQRGLGYPIALAEAHEQAVVSGTDREEFQQLLEIALLEKRLPATTSAKSRSKRTRWI